MKIKISALIISTLLFTSCVMNYITWNANKRIQEVELGMNRNQVVEIMGKLYIVNSAAVNTEGEKEEILAYKSDATEEYRLKFLDNKLVSWDRVHITPVIRKEQIAE
jgi:outer membrane protein assembly factor BamE (lipoprotein component of BamABCDE complex)